MTSRRTTFDIWLSRLGVLAERMWLPWCGPRVVSSVRAMAVSGGRGGAATRGRRHDPGPEAGQATAVLNGAAGVATSTPSSAAAGSLKPLTVM